MSRAFVRRSYIVVETEEKYAPTKSQLTVLEGNGGRRKGRLKEKRRTTSTPIIKITYSRPLNSWGGKGLKTRDRKGCE